ncbi:hypothetical protein T265_11116 [Opisthorchis viverrini]|uniref:Uncharacterized protein n=1 Tax=Opisthorchis viverrini TaxID=6198 RepID=A0A074Z061_OPIVI|nr:hypothetical protein T265_11116 [Opisthorchis viverrini]KER20308.1 hypothetical protein T265_11116 [Opisthorchis viverrini]
MPLRELLGLVLNVVSLKEQLPTLEQTKIKKEALERHLKLETLGMTVRQSNTEIKLEPSSEPINESENGEVRSKSTLADTQNQTGRKPDFTVELEMARW